MNTGTIGPHMGRRKLLGIGLVLFLLVVIAAVAGESLLGFITLRLFVPCTPYYTIVYYDNLKTPDKYEFVDHLAQEGWTVSLDYAQTTGEWEVVRATKEFHLSSETAKATVRVTALKDDPETGGISIFIEDGSVSVHRQVFDRLVQSINARFDLKLDPSKFNYVRECD
ncbi:MAG: hypothetical protein ACE5JL_04605 [Dehalococcoidia bacterium]